MERKNYRRVLAVALGLLILGVWSVIQTEGASGSAAAAAGPSLSERSPASFNYFATTMFALAVLHTFLAARLMKLAHKYEHEHQEQLRHRMQETGGKPPVTGHEVSFKAEMFHFLGEIEVIFGLWVIPLFLGMIWFHGWEESVRYLNGRNFTEPLFVLVIMTIASSRPVIIAAQRVMAMVARIGGGTVGAWWLSIMTLGPILGSFITEPAAMTISALLLSTKFFERNPSPRFAYASLGLLFVHISIGGTFTHFAAPPVLMVAGKWGWDMAFMMENFGWKSGVSIVVGNLLFWMFFRKELKQMNSVEAVDSADKVRLRMPKRMIVVHLMFLAWTVLTNHYPVLFLGGFLFFLGFAQATSHHQDELSLRGPLLVSFFLAGLVIHGGLQEWWITPLLGRLDATPLFFGAAILTAFNDNAAVTYLASLVPNLSDQMKYAVVAGAVAGGGLTVIANAPNPAGAAILRKFFKDSVSPMGLLAGALVPTAIAAACFLLFP